MKIYDLIGVGFGPSNIALGITIEEYCQKENKNLDVLFLEKQPSFAWHPHMLLQGAHMQISFLKDLATPRNPSSKYTFLNYLHQKGRLQSFTNLKTFFPSRYEFNDYLTWCASHFDDICNYNREVTSISPISYKENSKKVELLKIITKDSNGNNHEYISKSIVIAAGGRGFIPETFDTIKNDHRVFHSSYYLKDIKSLDTLDKVAVIGAGQSAAEIFMDLNNNYPSKVDLIARSWAFKPSDNSPFVNEIFNPEFIDYVFNNSAGRREELLSEYRNTNYAAPDLEIIQQVYNLFYEQQVLNNQHHSFLRRHEVDTAEAKKEGIILNIKNLDSNSLIERKYDAVILATGYNRTIHEQLLEPVKKYISEECVDRDYSINFSEEFKPMVFLQGCCESTHGLGDSLLSNLSIRSEEIYKKLNSHLAHFNKT